MRRALVVLVALVVVGVGACGGDGDTLGLVVGSALKAGADVGAKSPREKWADFTDKADPKMGRIADDLKNVEDAASEAQPGLEESLRRLRCLTLEEHITADYKVLTHSPDKKLNKLTKLGLSAWRDGARACKQGNFAKAVVLVTRGSDYIDRTSDRKQIVNAKYFPTPPTTLPPTTLPPPTTAPSQYPREIAIDAIQDQRIRDQLQRSGATTAVELAPGVYAEKGQAPVGSADQYMTILGLCADVNAYEQVHGQRGHTCW